MSFAKPQGHQPAAKKRKETDMSLEKVQIPSQRPIYPTPAGLVTTVDRDGNPNIITLGESMRKAI